MVGRAMGKNNAFGDGSPNWNLSFPDGNMTAAELLAYTPHWLKSIDVILRLVNHGGRAVVVAHLISKYRDTVKAEFHPNSACVMMHYAMRRAGNEDWTINTRSNYSQERVYDEDSLYVGDFRPPRVTHPKSVPAKLKDSTANPAASSIEKLRSPPPLLSAPPTTRLKLNVANKKALVSRAAEAPSERLEGEVLLYICDHFCSPHDLRSTTISRPCW